jgi:hypothetical protein
MKKLAISKEKKFEKMVKNYYQKKQRLQPRAALE